MFSRWAKPLDVGLMKMAHIGRSFECTWHVCESRGSVGIADEKRVYLHDGTFCARKRNGEESCIDAPDPNLAKTQRNVSGWLI